MTLGQLIVQGLVSEYWRVYNNPLIAGTPYLLSMITAYSVLMAGKLRIIAWRVGLVNQLFWLTWIFFSGSWGFLLMNLVMWYVNITNLIKWRKQNVEGIFKAHLKSHDDSLR